MTALVSYNFVAEFIYIYIYILGKATEKRAYNNRDIILNRSNNSLASL